MNKEQQIIEWFEKEYKITTSMERFTECIYEDYDITWRFFLKLIYSAIDNDVFNIGNYAYNVYFWTLVEISRNFPITPKLSFKQLRETLIKKNRDYGNSFDKSIKKYGWIYLAIELDKKKNRLHSLLKSKEKPNYESIEDTLLDIAGYCVLALIYIENNKGLM